MGKSKKTRWRTFEINGSQDEKQTNGVDVKVNGTDLDSPAPVSSQKYSQILGDHHTNSSTNQFNRNSSNYINKPRGYNNKENFNNQRTGARSGLNQRSWQRGGGYRTSTFPGKDNKPDENGSSDAKVNSTAEPIKFNEDEYTRITTPRQDVLFKKGYLSRMNNKTATNLSATVNSTESTAASSTITTSDPDSSVSTLSPATTPSMDYGQADPMDYGQMYYPGYYDENGMLVIPMYNGYNYYPQNGSSATSPVYLMPYPYQYDPFFMTPGGLEPVDGDEAEDKTETDGEKENNQHAENKNGHRSAASSSDDSVSNFHGEESKEDKNENVKLNGTENAEENTLNEANNLDEKSSIPIYPNELNGYMYPAYPNGYYNNFYYYNGGGGPSSRPPKMKRRKRFLSSRNSHHQPPQSAETTTDYSDDESTSQNKRFNPRFQNGWVHYNGYNHYNGRFHKVHMDQNANQTSHEFHLNVDVQEFYPRVHSSNSEPETNTNCDGPSPVDLACLQSKTSTSPKAEGPKTATRTSHASSKTSNGRASKKEIIESIKSMEQQNIDLMATKPHTSKNTNQDDEWNVIKKGKKVKVVKDIKMEFASSTQEVQEVKEDKTKEIKIEEDSKTEITLVPEAAKKLPPPPPPKSIKKVKGKGKKKKSHLLARQDGFQIIEPDFKNFTTSKESFDTDENAEALTQDIVSSDNEGIAEPEDPTETATNESEIVKNVVLEIVKAVIEPLVTVENDFVVESVAQELETDEDKRSKVDDDLHGVFKKVEQDDAVIDISDEDICRKVNDTSLDLASVQAMGPPSVVEPVAVKLIAPDVQVEEKPDVQVKTETALKLKLEMKAQQKEVEVQYKQVEERVKQEVDKKMEHRRTKVDGLPFQDMDFFNDHINIAALERDLMENLRLLDDEIELKSPIINPLYDFPITAAVQSWLHEKQNESFDNLFHVQNFKKLSELFNEEDDGAESDISEKEAKSETDSDYASDFQAKANGSSPTCSSHAKSSSDKPSKCNKLIAVKESFCALM